jgi:CheY-like chemotaxis protein
VSIVRSVTDKKNLPIHVTLDPTLPSFVAGDEARLRQALLNLLNNAAKFTLEGHIALTVTHEGSSPAGEILKFSVTDTGVGIPEDKRGRLFERFSQADGSIKRQFGGTGLGLAISKRLVKLLGGEIGLESLEGAGSTFWFTVTLPRADATRHAPPAASVTARAHRSARILLVEDLDINQDLAKSILEAVGHKVDVASNGVEAVAAVQEHEYDLVLMDIQMPIMDGVTATQRIRELDHPMRNVPIVAMTANVLPQQITGFKQAGMVDHIGKPFKRDKLYAVVDRWVGTPGAEPPNQDEPETDPHLDQLRERFKTRLGEQLGQLEAMRGELASARDSETTIQQIKALAHMLAGSSGAFGFALIGEVALALEEVASQPSDARGSSTMVDNLDHLVRTIEETLAKPEVSAA